MFLVKILTISQHSKIAVSESILRKPHKAHCEKYEKNVFIINEIIVKTVDQSAEKMGKKELRFVTIFMK